VSKPLILIGSSSESKHFAAALQESLDDELSPILWSQLGLTLSQQILDDLEVKIGEADFAAFLFSPDDRLEIRGEETAATRDNVLIELGLARGILGKDRVFTVMPSNFEDTLHIPTDLSGVIGATYQPPPVAGTPDELKLAFLEAANSIRTTSRRHPTRPKPSQSRARRVGGVLDRGSTEVLKELADAAIYVADKRHTYPNDLRRFVRDQEIVPSKYLYWTPQGSAHWLTLCRSKKYQYYRDSLNLLREHSGTLVDNVVKAAGSAEIDFVSVGSGDGVKDNILLSDLQTSLREDEFIYYYPVDISDTLIVEAIRNALRGGLPRDAFKVKALIADFLKLAKLQAFYEERPATNLFSILGNTVGNADEEELFDSISEAMLPGDLVLMEVNVGEASAEDAVWKDLVTLKHDFTPLAVLNVPFERSKMKYTVTPGEGIVEGTKSIVASYKEAKIGGPPLTDIRLSIIHYYEKKHFMDTMEERMNVKVVWHESSDDVLLVLAQRDGAPRNARRPGYPGTQS
jgi:uncharacterized SAM-dependent methyltransferase